MAAITSYDGVNSGIQVAQNYAPITANFVQSETLNQACLRALRTTNPEDDKKRIMKTNGGLLKDSYCWILDNEEFKQWQHNQRNRLLWIRGDPGKGKTMLLCGIIDELTRLHGSAANISFFFCQATDVRINNATSVLRGLIYLLVEKSPSLLSHVRAPYEKAGETLFEDINAWTALSTIFTDILKDPSLNSTYIIIDALDECTYDLRPLLDLVLQESSAHPQIKWIVSSRNWLEIIERLDIETQVAPISLELNDASVSEAVNKYIRYKVNALAKVKKYKDNTRETIYRHLLSNSQGTFLWVALVCQNLDLTLPRHAIKKLEAFPPGLDDLYGRMIDQVRQSDDAEVCKQMLAIMSTVYRPITLSELTSLVEVPDNDSDDREALSEIIAVCGSFLTLREDIVTFIHQSAKDFLLREALNEILPRGIGAEHHIIFSRSLEVMFETLRYDIFDIKSPGFPAKDVRSPSPNPLAAVEYACVYWVDHLQGSERNETYELSLNERGDVDKFLQQKYLHWLEGLSILGSVSNGIQAMQRLLILIQDKAESQSLLCRAQDASRFIRYFRTAIESSPLQVYHSPLIFSPTESLTRQHFRKDRPDWVLNNPMVEEGWSLCLQILEGHGDWVNSIAWSPDGSRLASASNDTTVRIWDAATGQSMLTLEGHSEEVHSIAWSPDGTRLALASYDRIVRIWDAATGESLQILEGHGDWVNSIAWSPDGSRLASASYDETVRIWDVATSESLQILEGHGDWVNSIAWSPDGSRLASASYDKTVRIWDAATGQSMSTLEGHSEEVTSVSWSLDGARLASASYDATVRIWDAATGQSVSTLKGHSTWITSVSWSQDGTQLASASYDETVRIWDAATSQGISTLEGHSNWVNSISWSPDGSRLASASNDTTVRIWDTATSQRASNLKGHSDWINSIAWSLDGSRLASASKDKTVRIWDAANGQSVSTLKGHSYSVNSIAWSLDGSRLASASDDKTVRIWDVATSESLQILEGHGDWVNSIAWSPDGSRLASASNDTTVRIWDSATGQSMSTLEGHSEEVTSVSWSLDETQLASTSNDKTVRIWDAATSESVSTLEGHSDGVNSIVWSQDGTQLASASNDNTVRIWDLATGRSVSTLHIASSGFLQLDKFNFNHLYTSMGTFDIGSIASVSPMSHDSISSPEQYGYGLSHDSSWITYNGINLLWLPAEYRPKYSSRFSMPATSLAIGCTSGHIMFLAFTERSPIIGLS